MIPYTVDTDIMMDLDGTPREIYDQRLLFFFATGGEHYAVSTTKDKINQLRRIGDLLVDLLELKRVTTMDPRDMTVNDFRVLAMKMRDTMDVQPETRAHQMSTMNVVCKAFENRNVEHARARYPTLFPKEERVDPDNYTEEEYDHIRRYITRPNQSWIELRSSFSVGVVLFGGIRPQEDQYLRETNLDLENMMCDLQHVKGGMTYGKMRMSPIHPEDSGDLFDRYIAAFESRGLSGYLLQRELTGEPLSSNTIREGFRGISKGVGFRVYATKCRATWISRNIDATENMEAVSVSAGHSSSAITARHYGRMSGRVATKIIREAWKKETDNEDERSEFRLDIQHTQTQEELSERGGIRTLGLQLRRLPPYPG